MKQFTIDHKYITIGTRPRKTKHNEMWTPELRARHAEISRKRWNDDFKKNIVEKQIKRHHPWRQNYPL